MAPTGSEGTCWSTCQVFGARAGKFAALRSKQNKIDFSLDMIKRRYSFLSLEGRDLCVGSSSRVSTVGNVESSFGGQDGGRYKLLSSGTGTN